MRSDAEMPLNLCLIADDTFRIAMLRRAIKAAGIPCSITRVARTAAAVMFLKKKGPNGKMTEPDLVLCDFADVDKAACRSVSAIAFGSQRSRTPVLLLTSLLSETLLDSGELDDGQATMFAARPLELLLEKLAGDERSAFLHALAVLYQYGPVLARQPAHFLEIDDNRAELSA